jgi:hypothetical protein
MSLFLLFFISAPLFANDSEIKDLKWHKFNTKNFVVLSIDESQGEKLANNIEKVKKMSLSRWGIKEETFSAECRVFSVSDKFLMKKLFQLDSSKVEIKRNQGKIVLSIIWLMPDDIAVPISEVCYAEINQKYNNKISYCLLRGMCLLNGSVDSIRKKLNYKSGYVYYSKNLFGMTFNKWEELSIESKQLFDKESIILCLLLRKEFGEVKMHQFFEAEKSLSPEESLKFVYGFSDYKQFDSSLMIYMKDLCSDIIAGKTPDLYLEVKSK